jgi:signal transduction histidine kinase/FixJ family two-component response regulator
LIKQLFIAENNSVKKIFESVEKPIGSQFDVYSSIDEAYEKGAKENWYSIIAIDSPRLCDIQNVKEQYPAASILVTYDLDFSNEAFPDYVEELLYKKADNGFKRVLAKKLAKLVELRRLRRRNKLNEAFFERIETPIIITKKVGNDPFKVVSFNNTFLSKSIVTRSIKLQKSIDLFDLYSIDRQDLTDQGDAKLTKRIHRNDKDYLVDVVIFTHKLKYSEVSYQIAIEVGHKVDNNEVGRLKERLEYLDNTKKSQSEFLASVAHDLRKPLNNIIGLVDVLSDSGLKEEQAFIGKSLVDSSEMLKNLLSDVLDNSSLDAGNFEIVSELFEIRPFIQSIKTMFLNDAKEKGLKLKVSISDTVPVWLMGDKNRLSQILINLLSNAIKFTSQGEVSLNINFSRRLKDRAIVQFKVNDSGIGIEEKNLDSIFNSYNQGNRETKSKYGGTGLGLTITKKLTELMSGNINVESEYGKGTEFTVEIPFGLSTIDAKQPLKTKNALEGLSILVVDDNEIASFVLAKLIAKNGGVAVEAYTGNKALDYFKTKKIDLVITDIQLPDINGIRLSNKLKTLAKSKGENLPVIGLSAFPFPQRLKNDGFVDYFALKPISQDQLISKVVEIYEANRKESVSMKYKVIDIDHINNFTSGDPVFIKQLVDIFLKRTPEYMDELKSAVDNKDWTQIKTMAHKVKPTFTYVGMGGFTEKVGSIEDYAIKKDIDTIYKIMDEVWDDCQLAFDEFEDFVKSF